MSIFWLITFIFSILLPLKIFPLYAPPVSPSYLFLSYVAVTVSCSVRCYPWSNFSWLLQSDKELRLNFTKVITIKTELCAFRNNNLSYTYYTLDFHLWHLHTFICFRWVVFQTEGAIYIFVKSILNFWWSSKTIPEACPLFPLCSWGAEI